ncbi:hypothetical protein BC781_10642 [Sediminitomix flava]|uniref:Uncharacterized protein n=1 Tax=Sediminitomix flava TaxID=379075 RepID=A0A315Z6I7_SEDFL|nr:hypothetical protein BC781_10642 [Sediminitomix flava]
MNILAIAAICFMVPPMIGALIYGYTVFKKKSF